MNAANTTPHAHSLTRGWLYRAIVTLPSSMCAPHDRDACIERWVFFEVPTGQRSDSHIEDLLAQVWCVDTFGWSRKGHIYNVTEARQLISENDGDDDTALFEVSWGGEEGVAYVKPEDVDYFVRPNVRAVLQAAHARALCGTTESQPSGLREAA